MFQQRLRGYGRSRLQLPSSVVDRLLASDYAELVARPTTVRRALLPQIVSLHTRKDLDAIDGLGAASIRKIETWLAQHGTRLRKPDESIDAVICQFRPRSLSRFTTETSFNLSENGPKQTAWREIPSGTVRVEMAG